MTTNALAPAALTAPSPPSPFGAAVRAEWIKLRSVRATPIALVISIAAAVTLALLNSLSDVRAWDEMTPGDRLAYDPASTALIGVLFCSLVLGAMGVRVITSEYATGMIRTTMTAIPSRPHVVLSKLVVVAGATAGVGLCANVIGFLVGQAVLSQEHIGVTIAERDSIAAVVLGALAVASFAAAGLGIGVIVRRASIANILIALVVIGGQIVGTAIPAASQRFLPFNALQATVTINRNDDLLSPVQALGFIVGYAAIALCGAIFVIRRRDV